MRAGSMRYRIIITATAQMSDSFGQLQPAIGPAAPVLSCWADICAASSKEIYALGPGFTSQVTHKIKIRYPDVLPVAGMVVNYGTRTFTIQTTSDPTERQRELDLMCLEETK